jgi:L-amino acid N-acyltransferase YncA
VATIRAARSADVAAIAATYNEGIEERTATFRVYAGVARSRSKSTVPLVVVESAVPC